MRFYTNFYYLLVYFSVVWLLLFRDKVNTILQILLVFLFNWHQLRKKYIQLRIQTSFDGIKKGRELLLIFSVYYVHFFFIQPDFLSVMFCFFNNFFSLRIILNLDWPSKGHYNLFFCWETSVIKFYFACFIYLFIFGGEESLYLTHLDGKCRLNPLSHQPCAVFLLRPFSLCLSVWLRAEDLWGWDWDSILPYWWLG